MYQYITLNNMRTLLTITNNVLVVLFMATLLSCNSQSNQKYNQCVNVLNEHIKTVENCTDCEKLEDYYCEIGKVGGWNYCNDFLELFSPDVSDFDTEEWYWQELIGSRRNKLQSLYDELKSTIEKRFIQLNCTSEVIRAYISFYEELNAAITKCSDYKEYNSLVKDVKDCINNIYEDENCECYWQNHVSSFTLHRLVKASKNLSPEEDPIVTKIGQDYNNRIASIVSDFKAEEQYELLQKELYENSTLREKLHWLARKGAEKEWDKLIDSNTIDFDNMNSDYNNPIKADKKYIVGSDIILKAYVDNIKKASGKYTYVLEHDRGFGPAFFIYTNDKSFADLDYPHTVWIIAKYNGRYLDWHKPIYEFDDAELLAWSK